MGGVFPPPYSTGGAKMSKMSILPVEWRLLGGHTWSQNEEFVCLPLQQDGGTVGVKMGGGCLPNVVEFCVKGEQRVIKWVISPLQDCWDPNQGSPYHSGTVGAWGRVREGTWAFSPSHSSEEIC